MDFILNNQQVVIGTITIAPLIIAFFLYRHKQSGGKGKLHYVGKVENLMVHPIKSGKAIATSYAYCIPEGIKLLPSEIRDR